jgi:hypothetical protein
MSEMANTTTTEKINMMKVRFVTTTRASRLHTAIAL